MTMNGSYGSGIETFTKQVRGAWYVGRRAGISYAPRTMDHAPQFIDNPDKTIRIPILAVGLIAKIMSSNDFRELHDQY